MTKRFLKLLRVQLVIKRYIANNLFSSENKWHSNIPKLLGLLLKRSNALM